MAITYKPKKLLEIAAPDNVIEKLVTQRLTVNRATLNMINRASNYIVGRNKLESIAVKVIRGYKAKEKLLIKAGQTLASAFDDAVNQNKLLVQRVKQSLVHEITDSIKKNYNGEFYVWLPSSAEVPDEEHMKNYGDTFQLGVGESPGDRFGCQCGMKILVDGSKLNLQD